MMPGFVAGDATYRTRRGQLVVAAATVAIAAILAIGPLFGVKDRLAYTNNVPARTVATAIDPGSSMCRREVFLPSEGSGIRLYTLTYGRPGPPLALDFRTRGGRIRSKLAGGYPDQRYAVIPIAQPGRDVRGVLCIQNKGSRRVAFGGIGYNTTQGSRLKVDGRLVPADLAVEVTARKRSLVGIAPTVFARAT